MATEYDYNREADDIDEWNAKKLVAPNDNYKIETCATCGKDFIKRKNNSTKQLASGIRGHRSKNCSRMCTKMSKRRKTSSIKTMNIQPKYASALSGGNAEEGTPSLESRDDSKKVDTPQDCSGQANVAAKEASGVNPLPVGSSSVQNASKIKEVGDNE